MAKHKTKINKQDYERYRINLINRGIKSYIDQFGKIWTSCEECNNKKCEVNHILIGCMQGETEPEILKKIER